MKRIHPAFLLLGVVLFGLLTFAAGLILGLGLQEAQPEKTAPKMEAGQSVPPHTPAAIPPSLPAPPQATMPAGMGVPAGGVSPPPAALPEPTAAPVPAAPSGPVVKGLRSDAAVGQSGVLERQARTLAGQTPDPVASSDRIISVEVGRFLLVENAAERAAALAQLGFATEVIAASYPGMPVWHVVTLGVVPDERTARDLATDAATRTGLSAQVVSWQRPAS